MKYYSPSTNGFYSTEIHGSDFPSDVVSISDELHQSLIEGQDGDNVIGFDGQQPILKQRVKTPEELAEEYKIKRALEYPPMEDYLDGIVKGNQAQIQAYIDACLAVKAKYPKGA